MKSPKNYSRNPISPFRKSRSLAINCALFAGCYLSLLVALWVAHNGKILISVGATGCANGPQIKSIFVSIWAASLGVGGD